MDLRRCFKYNGYMEIRSADNQNVRKWEKLRQKKYRDEYGLFIVQERHLISEALDKGVLEHLLVREGCDNPFNKEAITVSDKVMKKLSSNVSLNDYIGICRIVDNELPEGNSFILLENVQDPGNVGTIIRTAYSFGYDAVILNEGCASLYNEKTIQSSQGALFHIPVLTMNIDEAIEKLHEMGVRIYATTLSSSHYISETVKPEKYGLLFGNEGKGLKKETVEQCDENIKIEMENFESLNVAVACGICAYYFKNSLK